MAPILNGLQKVLLFASMPPLNEGGWQLLNHSFYYHVMYELGSFIVFMVMMTIVCLGMMFLSEINNGRNR